MLQFLFAILSANLIGMFWYGPHLFGTIWARHSFPGKDMSEIGKDGMAKQLVVSIIGHCFSAGIINYLLGSVFVVRSLYGAVSAGLVLSGLVCATQVCHHAFHGKPLPVYLIDHGYDVAVIMSMCLGIFWFS